LRDVELLAISELEPCAKIAEDFYFFAVNLCVASALRFSHIEPSAGVGNLVVVVIF
jgi:hypothetical protein